MGRLNIQSNELADMIDVSESAVSNWLTGVNEAKGKNLRKLAKALSCAPGWLLGNDPSDESDAKDEKAKGSEEFWKTRAMEAERKYEALRSGVRALLEMTATPDEPPEIVPRKYPEHEPQGAMLNQTSSDLPSDIGERVERAAEESRKKV